MLDDQALVTRCQHGDVGAFEELVRRYEKRVYNLAYRMSGNPDDACELAQEAFLKVFNALDSFKGQSSFSTWLYRIAANACLDQLRSRGRHPVTSLDDPIVTNKGETIGKQILDNAPRPDEVVERRELQAAVQGAIASLPEDYRIILVLRDLQDLSYQQIAEYLDLSLGTVKSRLNRARLALKDKLSSSELFAEDGVYRVEHWKGGKGRAL